MLLSVPLYSIGYWYAFSDCWPRVPVEVTKLCDEMALDISFGSRPYCAI